MGFSNYILVVQSVLKWLYPLLTMLVLGVGVQLDSQKFLYTRLLPVKDGSVQFVARLQVTVRDRIGRSLCSVVSRATASMDDVRSHSRPLSPCCSVSKKST